jgi:hypothetical protein
VLLNAHELHWIVDNLFVSNRRSSMTIRLFAGVCVDLRNIKPPIIRSCSWRDSFAPLRWVFDWIRGSELSCEGTAARSRSRFDARSEQGRLEEAAQLTQPSPKNEGRLTWIGPLFAVEPLNDMPRGTRAERPIRR